MCVDELSMGKILKANEHIAERQTEPVTGKTHTLSEHGSGPDTGKIAVPKKMHTERSTGGKGRTQPTAEANYESLRFRCM